MTNHKHWKTLPDDQCNYVIPPKIQSMMSGVSMVKQDHKGRVTLVYTDNTTESTDLPGTNIIQEEYYFTLVSLVQLHVQKELRP